MEVPLMRYSWTTDHESSKIFNWSCTQNDLKCIIEPGQALNSTIFKITEYGQLRENFDISEKLMQTEQAKQSARTHGITLIGNQLPVYAIFRVESLTIAIKYNMETSQIRRFQVKLSSYTYFDQMMKTLKDLGCDMNEHKSADSMTSNTALNRPATAMAAPTAPSKPKKQTRPASSAAVRKNAKVTRMPSQAASQNQYVSPFSDLVPQDHPDLDVPAYQPSRSTTTAPQVAISQSPAPELNLSSATVFQPFRTATTPAVSTSGFADLPIRDFEKREILQKLSDNLARMPPRVETPWARSPANASSPPAAAFSPEVAPMPTSHFNVQSPPFEPIESAIPHSNSLRNFKGLDDDRRHDIIEQGIKECLQDDNFIQFCQDLWSMWPRIGLDLKFQANNLH